VAHVLAPTFWVTGSAGRLALAREVRSVLDWGNPGRSAVQQILNGKAADPQYASSWRPAKDVRVQVGANLIEVRVSAEAFSATGVTRTQAQAALQQLAWTVTSAVGRDLPVKVTVPGQADFRAWNLIPLGQPMRRDLAARAAVWIDTPLNSTQNPQSLRVCGQGSAASARYQWWVARGGVPVNGGFTTGTPGANGWSTFAVDLKLPAGGYEISVAATDTNGVRGWPDSKSFVVS
jgi:hypothetical protein